MLVVESRLFLRVLLYCFFVFVLVRFSSLERKKNNKISQLGCIGELQRWREKENE